MLPNVYKLAIIYRGFQFERDEDIERASSCIDCIFAFGVKNGRVKEAANTTAPFALFLEIKGWKSSCPALSRFCRCAPAHGHNVSLT